MSSTVPTSVPMPPAAGEARTRVRAALLGPGPAWGSAPGILLTLGSMAMVASGLVHLHLWDIAYRHVATLGPLFVVQGVAAVLLGLLLAVTRRGLVLLAALGLMAGTIVGFILVTTVGLFGFTLHDITGWADLALATEGFTIAVVLTAVRLAWTATLAADHPPL